MAVLCPCFAILNRNCINLGSKVCISCGFVHVFQEEFLLTGPSALGMFVTSEGISQRPPLQWSENLISVGYVHPYIIAMNDEFITVHRYENDMSIKLQPCNYQLSKSKVHEIKFGGIAVM